MAEMIPFRYGGFWDVPRFILLRYGEQVIYLKSPFDDDLDEYRETYSVYSVPNSVGESVLNGGDWKLLDQAALSFIGLVPINAVTFDSTKRKSLDSSCLESIMH